jgi:RimJ/RimL family protein N-acetyltransferase
MTADNTPTGLPADIRLDGLGLVLREWTADDLPVMVELFDDPQVDHWTPLRSPFNLAAAHAYLDKAHHNRIEGRRLQLAITTDGYEPKGEILLARTGDHGRGAELAYAVGPRHRRQRLATRAVQLITTYAYDVLAMKQVILRIAHHNQASTAVARSAGFELTDSEPITREGSLHPLHTWRHPGDDQAAADTIS